MKREEAMKALEEITKGIDGLEDQDDQGWWETSAGAEFGARKLSALKALIATLVPEEVEPRTLAEIMADREQLDAEYIKRSQALTHEFDRRMNIPQNMDGVFKRDGNRKGSTPVDY